MRMILGLSVLALAAAAPAFAQPQYAPPRGSYERQCTDIRMNGQFLSATCRGARGGGPSSINILSCSSDISVDESGALTCTGPGGGAPPTVRDAPPGYAAPARPGYDSGAPYRGRRGGHWRESVALYGARNWRGQAIRIEDATPNLGGTGLNDRVRSIQLEPGSGPWIVCTDANYRGRCATIRESLADTRRIGMGDSISSLRPAR